MCVIPYVYACTAGGPNNAVVQPRFSGRKLTYYSRFHLLALGVSKTVLYPGLELDVFKVA